MILNQEGGSYDRPLHQQLQQQIEAHSTETGIDRPGGVFLARLGCHAGAEPAVDSGVGERGAGGIRGSLQQQLVAAASERAASARRSSAAGGREEPSPPLPFLELPYFNGLGGFTPDGREYAHLPARPKLARPRPGST